MSKSPINPLQPGQRFGRLTVIEYAGHDKYHAQIYRCRCDCGNEKTVVKSKLVSGHTTSCGCLQKEAKNQLQPGQRFGRLTVIEFTKHDKYGVQLYRCQCDCGNETTVQKGSLTSGTTKSCGCLYRKIGPLQYGQRFGKLTVIEYAGYNKYNEQLYRCRCDCGNEITVRKNSLVSGHTSSCGCLCESVGPLQQGQRFGRLTVMEFAGRDKYGLHLYRCRCDCGNETTVMKNSLVSGNTKSCGCLFKERFPIVIGRQDGTCVSNIKSTRPAKNNTTGVRGVSYDRATDSFGAQLMFQGKRYRQRGFKTVGEAAKARQRMYDEIVQPYLDSLEAKASATQS